jgi:hypothetical protein
MKRGIRQMLVSLGVFAIVLLGVVSVDPVVRERFSDLVAASGSASSLSDRSMELVDSLGSAVKHQSIENAPLMIFATVGAVLFVFMVRT